MVLPKLLSAHKSWMFAFNMYLINYKGNRFPACVFLNRILEHFNAYETYLERVENCIHKLQLMCLTYLNKFAKKHKNKSVCFLPKLAKINGRKNIQIYGNLHIENMVHNLTSCTITDGRFSVIHKSRLILTNNSPYNIHSGIIWCDYSKWRLVCRRGWISIKIFCFYEGHPKINESCWISREPWHVAYGNFTCLWHSPIHTFNTKMNAIGWRHKVWRHSDWRHILDSVRGDTLLFHSTVSRFQECLL